MTGEVRVTAIADWNTLGLEPTGDLDAIKRAYRARLRETPPERDPEGFQRLRAAYEAIMAAIGTPPAGMAAAPPTEDADAAATEVFAMRLVALRAAGDEAGAIAAVDAELARHRPGSAAYMALEDEILDSTGLSRNLSQGLFRHLVARFDWGDANGRAARAEPERHAILADRIAAEDWYDALGREEGIGRALVAPDAAAARRTLPSPLDAEGKARVRALFDELGDHAMFVGHRFHAGVLAAVREAVEGPPLVASPAPTASSPWAAGSVATAGPGVVAPPRRRIVRVVLGVAAVAALGAGALVGLRDPSPAPSSRPGARPATVPALSADAARRLLADAAAPWITTEPEPGGVLVSYEPLARARRGIADARYGMNRAEPDSILTLPENGTVPRFVAPPNLDFITFRLRLADGTWLPLRRYDLPRVKVR